MKITKVINNNVVSAYDDTMQEVVIMGKGIGFKAQAGNPVEDAKIEKIFRIEDQTLANQFKKLLSDIPLNHMQLSNDIITHAKTCLNQRLSQSIYVTLTDHINFSIERNKQGIKLDNALLWDIKKFYKTEFEVGMYAIRLMRERLGLVFSEDEAGFIALHFVNAEYDSNATNTFAMTSLLDEVLDILKKDLKLMYDEQSPHFERFMIHIKFLAQRIFHHEMLADEEPEFSELIQKKYPREYTYSEEIASYIKEKYHEELSKEEIMYLAIHIRRVGMTEGMEK